MDEAIAGRRSSAWRILDGLRPWTTCAANCEMLNGIHHALGTWATHGAYLGLSTSKFLPATFAMARRGENPFVTSYLYNVAMGDFYALEPGEGETGRPLSCTKIYNFDHHEAVGQ